MTVLLDANLPAAEARGILDDLAGQPEGQPGAPLRARLLMSLSACPEARRLRGVAPGAEATDAAPGEEGMLIMDDWLPYLLPEGGVL